MQLRKSYIVCTSPRSGSTLLCDGLEATQRAGNPLEWFAPLASRDHPWARNIRDFEKFRDFQLTFHGATSDTEYIETIVRLGSSSNGVFGTKLHLTQISEAKRRLRGHLQDQSTPFDELLSRTFPGLSFIWLRRRDKVAQAISLCRALKSGEFSRRSHPPSPESIEGEARTFDLKEVHRQADILTGEDAAWGILFRRSQIAPLTLFYEDFAGSYQNTIAAVLEFIGIGTAGVDIPPPRLLKQADRLSEEVYRLYTARYPALAPDPDDILSPWVDALLA
jgi:trehalose 2-sulfotransferase